MIKLVILVDVLHTFAAGSERQILELCKNIDKDRFKVSVFCLKGDESVLNKLRDLNIEASCLNVKRVYGISGFTSGIDFFKYLKKEKTDVLMTYHFGSDVWGALLGKLAGVPTIVSNRRDMSFWLKFRHKLSYRIIYKVINKVIAVSKGVRDIIVNTEHVDKEKIDVIYNGIDLERFNCPDDKNDIKQSLDIPEHARIIGCVANIKSWKGQRHLIRAMVSINERYPDYYLLLVGTYRDDGAALREEIEQLVDDLKLKKKVKFLGRREDVPQLLSQFDICVLPTESEGLPNSLLEYMTAGKPIIATDIAGNNEVIENERNGLLVKPADPLALANKLMYLIENSDVCDRIGKAAYDDVIRKFSIQQMVDVYEQTIENLVAR